jgi:hypothetical protein
MGTLINEKELKSQLRNEFFYITNVKSRLNLKKIKLYHALYTGEGQEMESKSSILFEVLADDESETVRNYSTSLAEGMQWLIAIPCLVIGHVVLSKTNELNSSEPFRVDLNRLMELYSTNRTILKEYAEILITQYIFPP